MAVFVGRAWQVRADVSPTATGTGTAKDGSKPSTAFGHSSHRRRQWWSRRRQWKRRSLVSDTGFRRTINHMYRPGQRPTPSSDRRLARSVIRQHLTGEVLARSGHFSGLSPLMAYVNAQVLLHKYSAVVRYKKGHCSSMGGSNPSGSLRDVIPRNTAFDSPAFSVTSDESTNQTSRRTRRRFLLRRFSDKKCWWRKRLLSLTQGLLPEPIIHMHSLVLTSPAITRFGGRPSTDKYGAPKYFSDETPWYHSGSFRGYTRKFDLNMVSDTSIHSDT